ncbi:uncharacterized protein LDX57_009297 [Aspergillus melleus]|uniref:uncharacterized protein n=1 Tax=Aspergillus melleus TaxID=138277 RepID=UPI001E8E4A70|nr:uncharacterized protein LDX57_009297 [Aspergillus melleus]KAH8431641.1 hypothetical protein LDX57_009297 [Aspergillus melleus]
MAATASTTPFQIPQHVTALLSHLTSRPGVQSTFILSRKDGSIIQSTGLIASKPVSNSPSASASSPAAPGVSPSEEPGPESQPQAQPPAVGSPSSPSADPASPLAPTTTAATATTTSTATATSPPTQSTATATTPYQPSHAEALAAHVFAFVASATGLSVSLSRPPGTENQPAGSRSTAEPGFSAGGVQEQGLNGVSSSGGGREDGEGGEGSDREDDDEVKLLRMRTKKHEIVVVPDRKYLLCVVHDVAGASGGGSGIGGVGGRGR